MAAFPHRIISAVAKRITASPEFRCGDTCFIASIVAKPTDRSISSAHNVVAGAFLCPNTPVVVGKGQGTLMARNPGRDAGAGGGHSLRCQDVPRFRARDEPARARCRL